MVLSPALVCHSSPLRPPRCLETGHRDHVSPEILFTKAFQSGNHGVYWVRHRVVVGRVVSCQLVKNPSEPLRIRGFAAQKNALRSEVDGFLEKKRVLVDAYAPAPATQERRRNALERRTTGEVLQW